MVKSRLPVILFFTALILLPLSSQAQSCGGGGGGGSGTASEDEESRRYHRNRLAQMGGQILDGTYKLRPVVRPLMKKQLGMLKRMASKLPENSSDRDKLPKFAGRLSGKQFKALAIYLDRKHPTKKQEKNFSPNGYGFNE